MIYLYVYLIISAFTSFKLMEALKKNEELFWMEVYNTIGSQEGDYLRDHPSIITTGIILCGLLWPVVLIQYLNSFK